jgi:hypothetical protein
VNTFTTWWASLSCCQAAAYLAMAFIAFIIIATFWAWWRDPRRVELRMIKRKRRRERKAIAKARAVLLGRHDPAADRDCYRWVQR